MISPFPTLLLADSLILIRTQRFLLIIKYSFCFHHLINISKSFYNSILLFISNFHKIPNAWTWIIKNLIILSLQAKSLAMWSFYWPWGLSVSDGNIQNHRWQSLHLTKRNKFKITLSLGSTCGVLYRALQDSRQNMKNNSKGNVITKNKLFYCSWWLDINRTS